MDKIHIIRMFNEFIKHFLLIFVVINICCIGYYGYYIYKSFALIKSIESSTRTKLIYITDVKTRFIEKILMYIYNNIIISINDNNSLRRILQANSNTKITILIRSTGGYISSSDSMLNLLDNHKPKKIACVPSYAMSAATLLTLACDTIHMNKYAAIGPTDPQISVMDEMVSFRAIVKLIEEKPIEKIKDKVLISYYENKVLYDDNINYITKYIKKHKKKYISETDVNEIIKKFSYGDIPHHSEISFSSLDKVININNTITEDLLSIYTLLNFIFNIW
jgi:membrane-bound ClpP family serine protease